MKEIPFDDQLPYEKEFSIKVIKHIISSGRSPSGDNEDTDENTDEDIDEDTIEDYMKDGVEIYLEEYDSKKYSFISNDGYNYINLNANQILDVDDNKHIDQIISLLDKQSIKNLFYWYHTPGKGYQWGDPGKEWTGIKIEKYKEPNFELI